MFSRKKILAFLAAANLINAAVVGSLLGFGQLASESPLAQAGSTKEASERAPVRSRLSPIEPPALGEESAKQIYERLVEQLLTRQQELEKASEAVAERERQIEVVRAELDKRRQEIVDARKAFEDEQKALAESKAPSFDRLLKAYEGMEPVNAAKAMAEIYDKDREVVVDLLLGLKPRQAAGILDSLAATSPKQTADLSLEIWKRDPRRGKPNP